MVGAFLMPIFKEVIAVVQTKKKGCGGGKGK